MNQLKGVRSKSFGIPIPARMLSRIAMFLPSMDETQITKIVGVQVKKLAS